MPPLQDAIPQVQQAHRSDVETTQDQGVPNEIQTQEDAQTSTRAVKLVDAQSSPVERITIGVNAEESNGFQDEFLRHILSDQQLTVH